MKSYRQKKVAVLAGGIGAERQVSLQSGQTIFNAVRKAGLEAVLSDIRPDDLHILDDRSIDVFFLALHGQFGEDGQLQAILEGRGLCYTGSDSKSSRDAFDKAKSKQVFRSAGLTAADDVCIYEDVDKQTLARRLAKLGEKFVVKPIKQGSSIGVEIVDTGQAAAEAAAGCVGKFGDCMIEKFIAGAEITVGLVSGKTLPVIEIRTKRGFYDYQAKYLDDVTEYLFDTISDKAAVRRVQADAMKAFESLGCRHFGRVDMILTERGEPYILEINTLPGFTSHSLLPMAAAKAGMTAEALCVEIIKAAIESFKRNG